MVLIQACIKYRKKEIKIQKILCQVTEAEKKDIQLIFEKKTALENLFKIITNESEIYERIIQDYTKASKEYTNWWQNIAKIYHIDDNYINKLVINFETNEILCDEMKGGE